MASNHAILRKKFEEFETHVYDKLQKPIELQSQSTIEKIQTKIDFFKSLFAMEIESSSPENLQHLEELVDKLSALEKNFDEWVNSGSIEGPVSPCSCTSSCFGEEEQEEDQENETNEEKMQEEEQEQEVEADKKDNLTEEKTREELEVNLLKKYLENIIAEKIEKADEEKRRDNWIRRIGMVGAATVLAAIGLALVGIGSVEESVYFVPT